MRLTRAKALPSKTNNECYERFIFTFTYMLMTLNHAIAAWFTHFISYI